MISLLRNSGSRSAVTTRTAETTALYLTEEMKVKTIQSIILSQTQILQQISPTRLSQQLKEGEVLVDVEFYLNS
jgi:hypothetical protein